MINGKPVQKDQFRAKTAGAQSTLRNHKTLMRQVVIKSLQIASGAVGCLVVIEYQYL